MKNLVDLEKPFFANAPILEEILILNPVGLLLKTILIGKKELNGYLLYPRIQLRNPLPLLQAMKVANELIGFPPDHP